MTTDSAIPAAIAKAENDQAGMAAVFAAVPLIGIGSVASKASNIAGPVLAFHRALGAAVLYMAMFLVLRGRITVRGLKAAAPGGLLLAYNWRASSPRFGSPRRPTPRC